MSERDAVRAVRLARESGWKVAVRSGGHSWSGSHLREGGLLLDLSRLQDLAIDEASMRAAVQPGLRTSVLAAELRRRNLFFPTGHCTGPCLGGYLLQGGFGWNSRVVGPACMSVTAIDVVTADGEMVRADESRHSDLLWAARGSGPGFFGAVTRFHLRLHPRPAATLTSSFVYPIELLEDVFTWARKISASVPRSIELMVFMRRGLMNRPEPSLLVLGPALADSAEQARADLEILETCPVLDRALAAHRYVETDVTEIVAGSDDQYPAGWRYAVDNMWTSASAAELLPGLRRIAEMLPASPSHLMWMNWGPSLKRPAMAYSLEDMVYLGLYVIYKSAEDDAAHVEWTTGCMREMEHLSTGIQLADENLGLRPALFVSDENLKRLDELRAVYDPDGRFHTWMGRPDSPRQPSQT